MAIEASTEEIEDNSFYFCLALDSILGFIWFVTFLFSRWVKKTRPVFEPRCHVHLKDQHPVDSPGPGMWSWLKQSLLFPNDKLLLTHGVDGIMYCYFLRGLLITSFILMLYCLIILLPLTATSPCSDNVTGLDLLTLRCIADGSARLWGLFILVVLMTAMAYHFLYVTYKKFGEYRQIFKARSTVANCTVLVRDIPLKESRQTLRAKFEYLFPGEIVDVVPVYHSGQLRRAYAKYCDASDRLRFSEVKRRHHKDEPPPSSQEPYLTIRSQQEDLQKKVQQAYDELIALQKKFDVQADGAASKFTGSAFVMFKSLSSALRAASVAISAHAGYWQTFPAPEPRDVNFDGLTVRAVSRMFRVLFANLLLFIFIFLSAVPFAVAASISQLSWFGKSSLTWLAGASTYNGKNFFSRGFIEGWVPPFLYQVFLYPVPFILRKINKLKGFESKSTLDRSVFRYFYAFQVWTVFYVTLFAGAAYSMVQIIINEPSLIPEKLAEAVNSQAGFFMTYVMFITLQRPFWRLLHPIYVAHMLLRGWRPGNDKELIAPRYAYERDYADHVFIFLLVACVRSWLVEQVFTYSVISPIMSIFGFMYYLCTYITARYNLIYGHTTQHDGGGASWPAVFECACVSLGLFQLTTAGIFILVRSYVASGILVLLFVFTFIFWWLCSTHFTRISYGGSMERCVAVPPPTVASHRTALPPNGVHLLYQAKCFVPPPPPTHPPKLSFDVNVHAALPPPKEVQVIDVDGS